MGVNVKVFIVSLHTDYEDSSEILAVFDDGGTAVEFIKVKYPGYEFDPICNSCNGPRDYLTISEHSVHGLALADREQVALNLKACIDALYEVSLGGAYCDYDMTCLMLRLNKYKKIAEDTLQKIGLR